ncbi:MAG: iron ABC transporter permease [Planctomycetia bacterium]|nr:iron ABC transporter permease [Planctomycetia bacterium]
MAKEHPQELLSHTTLVKRPRPVAAIIALLLILLLVLFLVVPLFLAVGTGFVQDGRLSGYWLRRVVTNRVLLGELFNGVVLACATTALALVLALPPALIGARYRYRGKGLLGMLLLAPLILPPFVGALSMRHLFSQFGVFNLLLERMGLLDFSRSLPPDWLGGGFAGVVFLQALHLFPILYLNASAAAANIDPTYTQAARNLGAGPVRTFFKVTLPLMRPGLFAGGTIVFIWALTDIGTPAILGYDHLAPVRIFKELASVDISPRTYSLVFLMLSGSVTLYILGKFLFGRSAKAETSKASVASEFRKLGPAGTLCVWLVVGGTVLLALLPHIGVILTAVSGRWVNTILPTRYTLEHLSFVLTRPSTYNSILNSLRYAGVSTAIDLAFGCVAAWVIVRARVRGKTVLDGLSMLPLAVPGLILAAGYVAMTAPGTPLEAIGPLKNPFAILVIAYAVRRLPFVVRGVSAGLEQVPEALEEAARNLGASRLRTALRITAPLIAANILAAGVLAFAFAMLSVSDSLILAQVSKHYPITKQIYILATSGTEDAANVASALGVFGMAFLGVTLGLASALLGKRLGAIFRA